MEWLHCWEALRPWCCPKVPRLILCRLQGIQKFAKLAWSAAVMTTSEGVLWGTVRTAVSLDLHCLRGRRSELLRAPGRVSPLF